MSGDGRAWRKAVVERALAERQAPATGEVSRVVVEASALDGERGLVTVSLRDGRLVAVDDHGERASPLVSSALGWLEALSRPDGTSDPGLGLAPGVRTSLAPSLPPGRTAQAPREVALALVRTGIAGARRGALDDALRRARHASDARSGRWLARFEAALAGEDVSTLAMLCRGAVSGAVPTTSTRVDLHLVEIARERLDAARPRSLERRYLIDLGSGAVLVEELDEGAGSLGPMPRALEVGLAEVFEDPGHPTARILQYTTAAGLPGEAAARLAELALREVAGCFERAERELRASPGWAEPLVLFSPAGWEPGLRALDASGEAIPWSVEEDPAACQRLAEVATEKPAWIALRASPRHGRHAFVPLSCALPGDTEPRIVRLRG